MVDTLTIDDLAREVQRANGNISELTGYMTTMAKRVYKQDVAEHEPEPEAEEKTEDWEKMRKTMKSTRRGRKILRQMEDFMDPADDAGNGGEDYEDIEDKARYSRNRGGGSTWKEEGADNEYEDDMPMDLNGEESGMMPYEDEEYQDEEMMMAMKLLRAVKGFQPRKSRKTTKGFADASKKRSDEEDTPFGEKDSDSPANEAQPAGRQGGDREEETFGPGGMAYSAMLKGLGISSKQAKTLIQVHNMREGHGQEVAKAIVPGLAAGDSRGGKSGIESGEIVTREMQEEAKKRSFRDLNRLRMDVGDLPRTLF